MKRFLSAFLAACALLACTQETYLPAPEQPSGEKPSNQPTPAATFTVTPTRLSFEAEGGRLSLKIATSIKGWEIECEQDWVSFSPDRGVGDATVFVEAAPWTNTREDREATLLLSATQGNEFVYISISQAHAEGQEPPAPSGKQPGWAELPVMNIAQSGSYMVNASNENQYYAWHICPDVYGPGNKLARNYTVCYSAEDHCPLWVAAPRHSLYEGSSGRTDAYQQDPSIPAEIQYNSKSTGGGCNKGHMLGSAERTASSATNRQVFYYSNIAPQLSSGFNTGGGGWNILEGYVDSQVCRDTLYEVLGCYFKKYTDGYGHTVSPQTISFGGRSDVHMPTMFYYVLLRTKSGNSGKSVTSCTASELKCVAFVRAHTNSLKGQQVTSAELMSVADLEQLTGVTYFPNVPSAPKTTFSASDWGL